MRAFYSAGMVALMNVGRVLMIMLEYVTGTLVMRIFLDERVWKTGGKTVGCENQQLRSYLTGSFL